MNILVLENRGSVSYYMVEALRAQHEVFDAQSITDAQSYLESERIDCFIIDLNMDPYGLEDDEIAETRDGLLTGWIWLREYVYKENPSLKSQTIIYTEYLPDLKANVPFEELKGIFLVPKRGTTGVARQVRNTVDTIARRLRQKGQ